MSGIHIFKNISLQAPQASSVQPRATGLSLFIGRELSITVSVWSQRWLQAISTFQKLSWVNKSHRVYLRSRRGAASAPAQTVCTYLGSDAAEASREGYEDTEQRGKEGHLWTSPSPSGASKEISWLLPTFLPLPHPTSILSSFVWELGTEHGFLIPHLLLPHVLTQMAQGGGRGFNLAWSCFCLHKNHVSIK